MGHMHTCKKINVFSLPLKLHMLCYFGEKGWMPSGLLPGGSQGAVMTSVPVRGLWQFLGFRPLPDLQQTDRWAFCSPDWSGAELDWWSRWSVSFSWANQIEPSPLCRISTRSSEICSLIQRFKRRNVPMGDDSLVWKASLGTDVSRWWRWMGRLIIYESNNRVMHYFDNKKHIKALVFI